MSIYLDKLTDDEFGTLPPPDNIRELRCFEVARYIDSYAVAHGGNTPSINDIAKHFNMSYNAAGSHVDTLRMYGLLVRTDKELVLTGSGYTSPDWLK